jgi:glucose-6-phosphate dehydrogenase assembly protein OpcA
VATAVSATTTVAEGWRGEPVTLSEVDRSLERQYRDQRRSGEPGLVRTRVATLVAVTSDDESARRALEVVARMTGRNPSRCIVLIVAPPAEGRADGVRAWAKVHRREGRGASGLRDEVVVEAAVPPGHLASVVLPLLLPDIPVFTWWKGTVPLDAPVGRELVAVTNRLIVDSSTFIDPVADLAALTGAARSLPVLSDAVWGRLTPWRALLAASFDTLPGGTHPDSIADVRVAAVTPTAGLLLTGWLTTRLGWEPASIEPGGSPGTASTRWRKPNGGEATIDVRPAAGSSVLASLKVEASGGHGPVTIRLEARGPLLIASQTSGQGLGQTRVGHCASTEAEALAAELEVFGHDRVYEDALAGTQPLTDAMKSGVAL